MTDDVRGFVIRALEKKAPIPFGIDLDGYGFLDAGHIDSVGVIKFVADLESRFDVVISDDEMLSDEFRTVGGLVAIVEAKRQGG